jgi:hypothetical protein
VPLVLFRIWSPNTYRQTHSGSRSTVAQYPLTLKLQFFWQQLINKESRPRALIERSVFTQSVTKELRQAWLEPDRTNRSARLSNLTARPSDKVRGSADEISVGRRAQSGAVSALPVEPTGPLPSSVSPQITPALHDVRSQVVREQKTISPKTFRTFIEKVFKNRLHTFVAERNILATSSARSGEFSYRPKRILAGGAWSSPIEDGAVLQQTILPGSRITRAGRGNVDMTPRVSVPVQSQFIHPEQAEWAGQNSLAGPRSRLFAQSASLNLASPPAAGSAARSEPQERTSIPRLPTVVQPAQPQLDMGRLSDEVYRHIQKKIRVERERRGL